MSFGLGSDYGLWSDRNPIPGNLVFIILPVAEYLSGVHVYGSYTIVPGIYLVVGGFHAGNDSAIIFVRN